MRGAAGLIAALALLAVLASCGTQRSADLFLVKRTGSIPGANLTLLVSDDGTVRCNGLPKRPVPSEMLLEARSLASQLAADKDKPVRLIAVVNPIYRFEATFSGGHMSWEEGNPGNLESFNRTAYFTRRVAKQVCGLRR